MNATDQVIRAARARADASASGDASRLRALLHDGFQWVSHAGERYDADGYVAFATAHGEWAARELADISVVAHEHTAVLRCVVLDSSESGRNPPQRRMPMTQVWVRREGRWLSLAGHAGVRG